MLSLSILKRTGPKFQLPSPCSLEVGRDREADKATQPWQQLPGGPAAGSGGFEAFPRELRGWTQRHGTSGMNEN